MQARLLLRLYAKSRRTASQGSRQRWVSHMPDATFGSEFDFVGHFAAPALHDDFCLTCFFLGHLHFFARMCLAREHLGARSFWGVRKQTCAAALPLEPPEKFDRRVLSGAAAKCQRGMATKLQRRTRSRFETSQPVQLGRLVSGSY